jgi:hypothetical protein
MRALVMSLSMLALTIASAGALAAGRATALRITYWEDGAKAAPDATWTLRCNPTAGTLPRASIACRRLAAVGAKLFAPVPRDVACSEIYGGPQRARVVGVVAGQRIWATFTRTDGCQVERWNRVSPWLLPRGGVAT